MGFRVLITHGNGSARDARDADLYHSVGHAIHDQAIAAPLLHPSALPPLSCSSILSASSPLPSLSRLNRPMPSHARLIPPFLRTQGQKEIHRTRKRSGVVSDSPIQTRLQ